MHSHFSRLARDRLQNLASTLTTLRDRVREAIASEVGKAVGEALRDFITVILDRKARRDPVTTPPPGRLPRMPDVDRWHDEEDEDWDDQPVRHPPPPPVEAKPPTLTRASALRVALTLARWLLLRRAPVFLGLGLGLAAGAVSLSGHPLLQAGFAAVAAASELIALTESSTVHIP